MTSFLPEHPGGAKIIMNYAGKDATPGFEPIHSPGENTSAIRVARI